ncbi:DNA polymerase IV [Halioxenophilus sp. WMMB6]|uniref:DNA polymerase IV n=1 Tax=Halioxenophilus sp. WMMB6 TaxID=3073815 RepID=UPI00295E705F|nr:DNA polymerase IV [Halioxenophilus sp. WMMB6]
MSRKIIHCDADCFFAAIEMRDNPHLRNRPLAVGGSADRRGVISTCNYDARRFGVRSAMPSAQARKLCPELIIVPGNMAKYKEASQVMRSIFNSYTDLVEPLSLDEAYLDVTAVSHNHGSATKIAEEIRARVRKELDITVSAGVSNSKFLAKIASDWRKPDGLFVVPPAQVEAFVLQLPVAKIHGVGKVTAAKLESLGIHTCADLRPYSVAELTNLFGSFGDNLYKLARGIDEREVKTSCRRKSLSVEHTYAQDLPNSLTCLAQLPALFAELSGRLAHLPAEYQVAKAFVKVKFADFTATTLERVGTQACLSDYNELMQQALQRKTKPVRLLGIGVRFDAADTEQAPQLELFALN